MQCGMTVLLLACEAGHEETAKLLVPPTLAAGLLDARSTALTGFVGNYAGYSALLWAKERALASVVEMLHASGAAEICPLALALFRGLSTNMKLDMTEQTVEFTGGYCTLRSTQRCPLGDKGYFELEILDTMYPLYGINTMYPQYGFVSAAFQRMPGRSDEKVGDSVDSWSFDGENQQIKHNAQERQYDCRWKKGDVLGLACDLKDMHLHVSVNGCFDAPNGLLFTLSPDAVRDGLFAAFTGIKSKLRYNLGEAPFKHAPPSADFKGFVQFGAE